ncbi:hypothetical protein MHZ95_18070 [Sporosarcina sp. ACRSM]|uniref:hypothetical protein n=1 Tax=Sporosarcina sp. ACRSM TaxID=2918216 RepID=UPI001EF4E3EC|nr:hypothetical protein [Sporosarcina sp. ACRSM]MCG7337168.1 hypothetical protein [Sporosarcina sp. ACRSM]
MESAINASELQIKFSQPVAKSSVIGTDGNLLGSIVTVGGAGLGASTYPTTLSADGKTLTIIADGSTFVNWEPTAGSYNFVQVAANKVTHKDSSLLFAPAFEGSYNLSDKTRASVTSVQRVGNDTVKLVFSEPIKAATPVYTYVDSSLGAVTAPTETWSDNKKELTIKFDASTLANKDVKIAISDLTDFANNVSVPYSTITQKVTSDSTAPTVVSAVATSSTTVKVTFSEEVSTVSGQLADIKVGALTGVASAASAGTSFTVSQKSSEKNVVYLTLEAADAITTSATVSFGAGTIVDSSSNLNAATAQTVFFNTDKVAPTIQSKEVVNVSGVNHLYLTFSEDVVKKGSADLTFNYTNLYGVVTPVTVPEANFTVDSDNKKLVKIELQDSTPADLPLALNYEFDIPAGYVTDAYANDIAKTTVNFTNTAATAPVQKLVVTSATYGATVADGSYIDVAFPVLIDPATAANVSNYAVEGATVTKATITSNSASGAVVRLAIKEGTIESSGNYDVTVNGVKAYAANSIAANETKNIVLTENVAPTVKSAVITSTPGNPTTIVLTFSEALGASSTTGNDFDVFVDGVKSSSTATTTAISANDETVTVSVNANINDLLAEGKKVELRPQTTIDIADVNDNKTNVGIIEIK